MPQPYGASEEFYRYNAPRRPSERLPEQATYLQGLQRGGDQTASAIQRGGDQEAAHTREMYAIAAALPEKLVKNFLDGMKFRQDRVKWKDDLDNTALKRDMDRNVDSRAGAKEGREVLKFEEDQARWPMERDELQGKINYMDAQRGYVGANTQKVDSERLFEQGDNPLQRGMDKFLLDQMKTKSDISRQGAAAGLDGAQTQKIRAEEAWLGQPAMVQPPAPLGDRQLKAAPGPIPYAPGKKPQPSGQKPATNRQTKAQSELDREAANAMKAKADAMKAQAEAGSVGKAAPMKLTEQQAKKRSASNLGALSEQQYQAAVAKGKIDGSWDPTSPTELVDNYSLAPKWMKADAAVEGQNAASRWVETFLRDESGASIPVTERAPYVRDFFPQPGDTPQSVADKKEARARKEQNAREIGLIEDTAVDEVQGLANKHFGGDRAKAERFLKFQQNKKAK